MSRCAERGFTLVEALLAVIVVGVVGMMIAPAFNLLQMSSARSYRQQMRLNHQLIVTAFMNYAKYDTTLGTLPAPYTNAGSSIYSAVFNTADTTLAADLDQVGLDTSAVNIDATASNRSRVYQKVSGLTISVPTYFRSGELATLTYDFGVVYMSSCSGDIDATTGATGCNRASGIQVPGASAQLTSANYTTWAVTVPDLEPMFVSTLPLQKQMLSQTTDRVDKVRDKLIETFRAKQLTAPANDTTNWYPTAAVSLSGQNAATNQGCHDGWYNLSTSNVLSQIGLNATEFGVNAWGGTIEYCRDYDPNNLKAEGAVPHYAALRILRSVSTGGAPSGTPANNIVFPI